MRQQSSIFVAHPDNCSDIWAKSDCSTAACIPTTCAETYADAAASFAVRALTISHGSARSLVHGLSANTALSVAARNPCRGRVVKATRA